MTLTSFDAVRDANELELSEFNLAYLLLKARSIVTNPAMRTHLASNPASTDIGIYDARSLLDSVLLRAHVCELSEDLKLPEEAITLPLLENMHQMYLRHPEFYEAYADVHVAILEKREREQEMAEELKVSRPAKVASTSTPASIAIPTPAAASPVNECEEEREIAAAGMINPDTCLPMPAGSAVDIGGNVFGASSDVYVAPEPEYVDYSYLDNSYVDYGCNNFGGGGGYDYGGGGGFDGGFGGDF